MKLFVGVATFVLALAFSFTANATLITYLFPALSGAQEVQPNNSPGTGFGEVIIDTTANTMQVHVNFANLTSGTTASHIHCCTQTPFTGPAGVATTVPTFPGFPLNVTSGTYDHLFNLLDSATYNPAFDGGTPLAQEHTLLAGLAAGEAYLNIHTSNFPGGEIRSFAVVPEPATLALLGAAVLGMGALRRRAS